MPELKAAMEVFLEEKDLQTQHLHSVEVGLARYSTAASEGRVEWSVYGYVGGFGALGSGDTFDEALKNWRKDVISKK